MRLDSKVVSTHLTRTHPEQPLPTGYNGIPFIVGQGDCLVCSMCVVILLDGGLSKSTSIIFVAGSGVM